MHQVRSVTLLIAGLALAGGCKKKDSGSGSASSSASASASASASSAGTGTGTSTATVDTASSGAITGLQAVSDCPKTLKGSESGVARTIKKECGTISVDGEYSIDGMLTIEGGVTLAFQPGAKMTVGYSSPTQLVIVGSKDAPVTFAPPTGAAETAGLWEGVHVYANAAHSSISGLVIDAAGNDKGALTIDATDVALKDITIKNATEFGLYLDNDATLKSATGLTFDHAGKIAVSLPPAAVGGLGAGNSFDKDAFVQVRSGPVEEDATWQNPGTYYRVDGQIDVDGKAAKATLTIAAGTELRFMNEQYLECGYSQPAKIVVAGTKDKPVVMKGAESSDKGAWKGLGVHSNGELEVTGLDASGGSNVDEQGVVFAKGGTLTVKDSKFSSNTYGITADTDTVVKSIDGNDFESNDKAWKLPAGAVGALGAGNTYAKGAVAVIGDGNVNKDATWQPQNGLEIDASSNISVDKATLTIAAGFQLYFDNDGMTVGYSDKASMIVSGTPDKPVLFRGVRDEAGSWHGLMFYPDSNDNKVENLRIENAENEAAVTVQGKIHVTINGLTCKGCTNAVSYECDSKVDQTGIKMEGGGTDVKKPEGC